MTHGLPTARLTLVRLTDMTALLPAFVATREERVLAMLEVEVASVFTVIRDDLKPYETALYLDAILRQRMKMSARTVDDTLRRVPQLVHPHASILDQAEVGYDGLHKALDGLETRLGLIFKDENDDIFDENQPLSRVLDSIAKTRVYMAPEPPKAVVLAA